MTSTNVGETAVSLYGELDELLDRIAAHNATADSYQDTIAAAEAHERSARRMSYLGLQRVMECNDRGVAGLEGYRSINDFMAFALRITDPGRRRKLMFHLMPMYSLTGELLAPKCPNLAAALADGAIGPDHAITVIDILTKIPGAVDPEVREAAEAEMAEHARSFMPQELKVLGADLLARIDPDGTLTDDKDRRRQRSLYLSKQDTQLMATLEGHLDPATTALLRLVLDAWAAPGMNMPDNPDSPCGNKDDADPEALKAAARTDFRTQAQRNHDALHALLKAVADGGLLGKSHRGLPPHLIVTITETALRERAGVATTAGGDLLPISEVIELAADAHPHLAVFTGHSAEPLYLGDGHRLANQAQRMMLLARDGAVCTCPGCSQPFTHLEVHHAEKDWADGGLTDIIDLAGACPKHNRMVGDQPGQWSTHIIKDGPDAGRPAWARNGRDGPGPARVNRTGIVAHDFARRLAARRANTPTHQNRSSTTEPKVSTGPPSTPEERRRIPRLIASGWAVTTIGLTPPN
ncbi:DUF222 domain-containing protein [Gordonia sp. CPCC 205515]|uniref:HNH endonuclease signature motif containing protein n=1 Tax=Gordonia sp. CPCC 205515 TaxID=3140791 RepID=UPI003AF3F7A2